MGRYQPQKHLSPVDIHISQTIADVLRGKTLFLYLLLYPRFLTTLSFSAKFSMEPSELDREAKIEYISQC